MAGTLITAFWFQALDDIGVAVPGALVNFWASGSSTRLTAYSDAGLTVPLANPQACDAAGRLVIYFSPVNYKVTVTTPLGVALGPTIDPVTSSGSGSTAGLGEFFVLGGDSTSPIVATAYPAGALVSATHAGTALLNLDTATLPAGTYALEAMLLAVGGIVTAALVNLSDGAPDTPLATVTSTSATGERVRSTTITFAAAGAAKSYAVKVKVSAGSGYVWAAKLYKVS